MNTLFILGSSRGDGHTGRLAREVARHVERADFVDIGALDIAPYDYRHANRDDDFPPLAQAMARAQTIIFASPVYWYSMSAQMKVFFDRLTDLTVPPLKPLGKSLAGKTAFAIATGAAPEAPESFTRPFADTAAYFNMNWGGLFYQRGADALSAETIAAARAFAQRIASADAKGALCA